MPFQKGHKLARGSNGQIRHDVTLEMISQLNEVCKNIDGSPSKRRKLHRLVHNLITKATIGDDRIGPDGKIIEGTGDTTAILAIIDRIEGRPSQKIVGHDDGPVKKAFPAAFDVNSEIIIPNFQPVRLSGFRSRKENLWIGGCLGAGDCLFQ
jgi:hypothetical protein